MKKIFVIGLSICLAMGLAGYSTAGKVKKEKLTDINFETPTDPLFEGTCAWTEEPSNGIDLDAATASSLSVAWSVTEDAGQTKYGGDAKFKVFDVDIIGNGIEHVTVDIGLTLEDLEGESWTALSQEEKNVMFVYDDDGSLCISPSSCTANLADIQSAILLALDEEYGVDGYEIPEDGTATFLGVFIKAMNPGKGGGSQDYEQDVCGFYELPGPSLP